MTAIHASILEQVESLFRDDLGVVVDAGETDLLGHGAIDSLQLVELLLALERRFGVHIDLGAVAFENFRSLRSIAAFVESAQRGATPR